jgi:hypothetical protein
MARIGANNAIGSGGGGEGIPSNTRNQGLTIFSATLTNAITISDGSSFNIFNSTDGLFSSNASLTISGDTWNRMSQFESDYIRPDPYTHTEESYRQIETLVFVRSGIDVGSGSRPVKFEIRRRTSSSPTAPVAIPSRDVEIVSDSRSESISVQRLPTRSSGASDNYYVYGYGIYFSNNSGQSITIPAGASIRIEVLDIYARTGTFNTLTSPNS